MRHFTFGMSVLLAVTIPMLALGGSYDVPVSCKIILFGKMVTHVETGFNGEYCVINGVSIGKAKDEEIRRKRIDTYSETDFVADMVSKGTALEDAVNACLERENSLLRELRRTIIALPSNPRDRGLLPSEIAEVAERYHDVVDTLWYESKVDMYALRYRSLSGAVFVGTDDTPEVLDPDPLFYSRLVEKFVANCEEDGGLLVMASSGVYALMYGKQGIEEALEQLLDVDATREYIQGPISRSLLIDILNN